MPLREENKQEEPRAETLRTRRSAEENRGIRCEDLFCWGKLSTVNCRLPLCTGSNAAYAATSIAAGRPTTIVASSPSSGAWSTSAATPTTAIPAEFVRRYAQQAIENSREWYATTPAA